MRDLVFKELFEFDIDLKAAEAARAAAAAAEAAGWVGTDRDDDDTGRCDGGQNVGEGAHSAVTQ